MPEEMLDFAHALREARNPWWYRDDLGSPPYPPVPARASSHLTRLERRFLLRLEKYGQRGPRIPPFPSRPITVSGPPYNVRLWVNRAIEKSPSRSSSWGITLELIKQTLVLVGLREQAEASFPDNPEFVALWLQLGAQTGKPPKSPESIRKARTAHKVTTPYSQLMHLRRCASIFGHTPTTIEFSKYLGRPHTNHHVIYRYWGSWDRACTAAGLVPRPRGLPRQAHHTGADAL